MTEISFDSLIDGKPVAIDVDGTSVCVARVGEEVFAIADTCSHSDASLSEGEITGAKIECWLHGAEFDLRTGEALTPPATSGLKVFNVERIGNQVKITN
jgi:3-phenylpropionate/trans-cinnamate dioxygenase ferredoxin subunit